MWHVERFWLFGAADFILWIDNLFLKSLPKAIPDYDRLLSDPAKRLRDEPVIIGPAKRYAVATVLGFLLAFPNWGWIMVLFLSLLDPKKGPLGQRPDGPFLLSILVTALIAALIVSILLMLWLWRGGQMVMKPEGVELQYRRSVVWCPWALFDAPGKPCNRTASEMLLPVQPEAVPSAEWHNGGDLIATGQSIQSSQLKFRGDCQARVAALYAVKLGELAELLLYLGRTLHVSVPDR